VASVKNIKLYGTNYDVEDGTARTTATQANVLANTANNTANSANKLANTANNTANSANKLATTNKADIASAKQEIPVITYVSESSTIEITKGV
jgi:F0F1-type ATP synthase epsilon subunit